MPQSRSGAKVIQWQESKHLRNSSGNRVSSCHPDPEESSKYLTPLELERAKEEGWNRVVAKMQNRK
jgi:hypothetical protein